MGTLIWGSSSRGSPNSARLPTIKAASKRSGVSGEVMEARVRNPDIPSFMA